jgi:hypothetical protein
MTSYTDLIEELFYLQEKLESSFLYKYGEFIDTLIKVIVLNVLKYYFNFYFKGINPLDKKKDFKYYLDLLRTIYNYIKKRR